MSRPSPVRGLPIALLVLAAAAPTFGCANDHDAMEKRLAGLREDINRVQAENDRLTERVDAIEVKNAPAAAATPATAAKAAKPAADATPVLKVVKLSPNSGGEPLGDGQTGDVAADDRVDAPGARPVIRLYGREGREAREGGRASRAVARQASTESPSEEAP